MAKKGSNKMSSNGKRYILADKILADKTTSFRNFRIDEARQFLKVDMCITTLKKVQMPNEITGEMSTYIDKSNSVKKTSTLSFPLRELSVSQIQILRRKSIPSFILKENNKYYYSVIPKKMSFLTADFLGEHLCSSFEKGCGKHQPSRSEKNGCKKVFDFKKHIENYDFIQVGFETINVSHEVFSVIKCKNYKCINYKEKTANAI